MTVSCFHGETPELVKRLLRICYYDTDGAMIYEGSLDHFRIHFPKFMIMDDHIFVTDKKHFGQA